ATADDTRYDDGGTDAQDSGDEPVQDIAQVRYSLGDPSWIEGTDFYSLDSVDGELDSSVEEFTGIIDTGDLEPGRHTVFIESQDADGNFGVPTAVFIDVLDFAEDAEVITGSDQAELLTGTEAEEVFYGLDGDDTIAGGLGDDLIFGNAGADVLRGDSNQALPTGEDGGNDMIYGGHGDDTIDGKGGNDTLRGEGGNDYIIGNTGNDIIRGGYGDDTLAGGDLFSDGGRDVFVLADKGTDVILDFHVESDFIMLPEAISFEQLSITQDRQDTLIDFEDSTMAVLRDVDSTELTDTSFV
ncbi:calcium-binding protein, partial [Hyella patelloides]|uniref:calcium-binding protein n=1 Tax=Hyella patelloides TaxID=1982969 RepID=UPI0011A55B15